MLQNVVLNETDGALGILSTGRKMLAIVGTSSTGDAAVPGTYARKQDVIDTFGRGPLVEAACYALEAYRQPLVLVRADTASQGNTTNSAALFADPYQSATFSGNPYDDGQAIVRFTTAGTVGVAGIKYRVTFDNVNYGPEQSLGTLSSFTIPELNVTITLETGKLIAYLDTILVNCTAPTWDATTLGAALTALGDTAAAWRICEICGPMTSSDVSAVDLLFVGFAALDKERAWIGHARNENLTSPLSYEAEATYLAAMAAAFASSATTHGAVCAGACYMTSGRSFLRQRRPASFVAAPLIANLSEEQDASAINLGALPGVQLRDDNGNVVSGLHDEAVNPGLDDARFLTLRTWDGIAGVYINNPRLMSAAGSDFKYMQHRLVMAIAKEAVFAFLVRRLSVPIDVGADGHILEQEAQEIEAGGNSALRAVLGARPKASSWAFVLSRTDLILQTEELTGQVNIQPLAYPKTITIDIGFRALGEQVGG